MFFFVFSLLIKKFILNLYYKLIKTTKSNIMKTFLSKAICQQNFAYLTAMYILFQFIFRS